MFGHFRKRKFTEFAVDVDHVEEANAPAEKRHIQQLLLEHVGKRARHDQRQQKGFVLRLVFDQQDGRHLLALGVQSREVF